MSAVRTTKGTLVKDGIGGGDSWRRLTEDEAKADADGRNKRAEQLGIEARYEVTES